MSKDKVYIIGVGANGASSLSPGASQLIQKAEILLGGQRQGSAGTRGGWLSSLCL